MSWDQVDKNEFAEWLTNMRAAAGLSKKDMAAKTGVSATMYSRYENPDLQSMPEDLFVYMRAVRETCLPIIRAKRGAGQNGP